MEELRGFTWIDTTVLVVYMIGVLVAGIYFSKKEMKGKEFFKGDGSVPWWVTCVSIFATLLSPISFLALAGNSYGGTWMLWFAQLGMIIAIPLTIRYFLPVYSRLDIDTAYHYLEIRFQSPALRVLGALMFVLFQLGRMSIVMYLPCVALANLTGISVDVLIIAMGAIAIVYSYTGGLKAVLWTDFIQGVILIGGITLTLFYMIYKLDGGLSDITYSLTVGGRFLADTEKWMDWTNLLGTSVIVTLVGGGLTTFCSYVSSQDVVQRFTTTTDMKQLNKMTIGNGILSLFCASVFYLVGTALYLYYQQNPDLITPMFRDSQDQVFAYFITYELPVGITGIILAALYAASQSTLSTGIHSVATSWVMDIQDRPVHLSGHRYLLYLSGHVLSSLRCEVRIRVIQLLLRSGLRCISWCVRVRCFHQQDLCFRCNRWLRSCNRYRVLLQVQRTKHQLLDVCFNRYHCYLNCRRDRIAYSSCCDW